MNALFAVTVASLAAFACAVPSGHHGGAIVAGPAGVVTNHGPIGPAGHGLGLGVGLGHGLGWGNGLGWGHGAVVAAAPVATAVVAGPALGLGHGLGLGVGHGLGLGLGHGVALGHGLGVVTNGGGTIGVSAHGAAVKGPGTAPVVVAGPSGKIAADGLWGPTANVGLTGGHGHGGWGHGGWGHGW
ncbi:glycine-rich cell wall structural protein-like [Tribolium madens]|uniref:glycine-rich cell wall structural protein-like n=1 Tax=Tribolium madens TaxID=41895 RepID=UPI001CF74662|nr:glycine-rich cell wall structural protein-like [Tribolium madens]